MNTPAHPAVSSLSRAQALERRYGEASALPAMPASAIVDALLTHRSVRAYLDTPLPDGTIELLTAAAQSAASSSNLQAWSVVAVQNPERKARLSVLANNQAHIRECPLLLVWVADLSRLDHVAESRGEFAEANRYLEMFLVAAIDAALAAQNAVIAAESLGLGTVYIGAMRNHPEAVATELALPPDCMAVFGLCVGYEDPVKPADIKPRLMQQTILHREQYSTAHEAEAFARYNEVMHRFQDSQGLPRVEWTKQTSNRVNALRGLSGRDRLREALSQLGFGLK